MTDATKVNFDTCYSSMVALDLVRSGNWVRSVYQMGRMYLATRDYEGENARKLTYEESYTLFKLLNDM